LRWASRELHRIAIEQLKAALTKAGISRRETRMVEMSGSGNGKR
jgi:hypothetical protein